MKYTNISRVLEIINKHPNIHFTLEELSQTIGLTNLSKKALSNALTDLVNYEYINREAIPKCRSHYGYFALKEKKELVNGRIPKSSILRKRSYNTSLQGSENKDGI